MFGPVLGILRVPDLDTAIRLINVSKHWGATAALDRLDDHLQALKKVTDQFKKSFQHLTDIPVPVTIGSGKGFLGQFLSENFLFNVVEYGFC